MLIREIADRHQATPAQVALAWLLAQKPWIVPLFGTRSLSRFEENIGALNVRLDVQDLQRIAGANITIQGERYPAEILRFSGK